MKLKNIFLGLLPLAASMALTGCSDEQFPYHDLTDMSLDRVARVELIANQHRVLADGKAAIELRPRLYTSAGRLIPDERVKPEWLEYSSPQGVKLSRLFSTADASLIGDTITAVLHIKGTHLTSNEVRFAVAAPISAEYQSEINIPVVFHVIQTTEDVEAFGGAYRQEQIAQVLRKLNRMLSGETTANPIGVDTRIRLVAAKYRPDGTAMPEPGIDRFVSKEVKPDNDYEDYLVENRLIWPAADYLNIWLVSDRKTSGNFPGVSNLCTPRYLAGEVTDTLPGINWAATTPKAFKPYEIGLFYKIQELDNIDRSYRVNTYEAGYNEIGYYLGAYFGLLPTFNFREAATGNDFCDDTINYFSDSSVPGSNETWYKTAQGCYFRAENIMDDPTGGHCSVSLDQCVRMRWVLEHCPNRAAWKSSFALTGTRE